MCPTPAWWGTWSPQGGPRGTASSRPGPLWQAGGAVAPGTGVANSEALQQPLHVASRGEAKSEHVLARTHRPGVSAMRPSSEFLCVSLGGHNTQLSWAPSSLVWLSGSPRGLGAPRSQVGATPRTCWLSADSRGQVTLGAGEALETGFAEITDSAEETAPSMDTLDCASA